MLNKPQLSVIIASYNAEKTIEACLRSLKDQEIYKDLEVIVVDSSADDTAGIVKEKFPEVRLHCFFDRKFPGDARNFGVGVSTGEIIAFIDTDCIADTNWVNKILDAHRSPYPAIGGSVANGNPDSYIGWAVYFCEFSQWMPQSQKRLMIEIPTCCLSLKRWAFDRYGPFLEGTYCEDTALNWRLGNDGYQPLFIPSIMVFHTNLVTLRGFIKKELVHGKFFAKVRVKEKEFSILNRTAFAMISPLLPFLLFFRIIKRVMLSKRYLKQFTFVSPLIFLGLIMWSFGEFLGYLSAIFDSSGNGRKIETS